MNALRSFIRAPVAAKAMALEAALLLLLAGLLVKHVPMRRWRRWLTTVEAPGLAGRQAEDAGGTCTMAGSGEPASAGKHPPDRKSPADPARHGRFAWTEGASGRRLPQRVAYIVRKVARHAPFHAVCLPQAMAAQWMLRRRGIASCLFFGVRRKAGGTDLEFHAWLGAAGKYVLGAQEVETYTALPPIEDVEPRPG